MFRVTDFINLLWSEVSGCRLILEGLICDVYSGPDPIGDNAPFVGKEIYLLGSENGGGGNKKVYDGDAGR